MLKTVGNPSTRYGDQTVVDGNIIIGTAGKGIDFSADGHAPGMTSELLDDYEEGTWTGTFTSATPPTNPPTATGRYTKIGRLVNVYIEFVNVDTSGGAGAMFVSGLPFASASSAAYTAVGSVGKFQLGASASVAVIDALSPTGMYIVNAENTSTSQMSAGPNRYLFISLSYMV